MPRGRSCAMPKSGALVVGSWFNVLSVQGVEVLLPSYKSIQREILGPEAEYIQFHGNEVAF